MTAPRKPRNLTLQELALSKETLINLTDAEESNHPFNRSMAIGGKNPNLWRSKETLLLDVPAAFGQQRVPSRGQTGRVRHLAAADEGKGSRGGQKQKIFQPLSNNFFDDRCCRAASI